MRMIDTYNVQKSFHLAQMHSVDGVFLTANLASGGVADVPFIDASVVCRQKTPFLSLSLSSDRIFGSQGVAMTKAIKMIQTYAFPL